MHIAENVELLEVGKPPRRVYPILLTSEGKLIMVDTGFPGQIEEISAEILKAGFSIKRVSKLIFTHQDLDHIGCVNEVLALAPNTVIFAHEAEKPYLEGKKTPLKISQMAQARADFSPDQEAFFQKFKQAFAKLQVRIPMVLKDKYVLPDLGGIEVIHTPGHTPGHICLYLTKSRVLIAGDALRVEAGELLGPQPDIAWNLELAYSSLRRLAKWKIASIVCFHGGLCREPGNQALNKLLKRLD